MGENKHNGDDPAEIGRKLMDQLDPSAIKRLTEQLNDIAPDMVKYVIDFAYGEIMARGGLSLRERELCIIASLVALGTEPELKVHIKKALNIGVLREEIIEVIIHQAIYSGFPRAINALLAAKDVFNE